MTSLRQAHKEMTRDRILDAAIELMTQVDSGPLTIANVADRASVTQRTVYRHFANRDQLLEQVWPKMQAKVHSKGFPTTADELVASPIHLFPRFDEQANLVRASAFSEAGLEVRLHANPERQKAMLACVADASLGLGKAATRRRAAIVQLINSAYGWAVLRDFWGLDGKEAGIAAGEAIAILLNLRTPADDKPLPHSKERK